MGSGNVGSLSKLESFFLKEKFLNFSDNLFISGEGLIIGAVDLPPLLPLLLTFTGSTARTASRIRRRALRATMCADARYTASTARRSNAS